MFERASTALRGIRPTPRGAAAVALLLAIVAAAALRAWAGSLVHGPWIQVDETIYAKLGVNLWRHGRLDVLGGPTGFYSLLYPAFAGLPLVAGGIRNGAEALRVLQAVTVSLTAIPVFLWARTLAPRRYALAAAVLALAPAGLAYSGLLMTEALFYPLLACTCWAIARALETPTRGRGATVAVLVLLCCATRLQAVVLIPAVVTGAALLAVGERRLEPLRRIALPAGALAAAGIAWIVWRSASGRPLLGSYDAATAASYSVGGTLRYLGYHLGDLILITGVFPLCAVALLGWLTLSGREPSRAVRAYAATALAVTAWIVVEVAAFASVHVGYVAERNIFTLAPLLFVGLAAWLGRGAPRPRLAVPLVGLAALGLCATLPLHRLLAPPALPFAPSSIGAWQALGGLSGGAQQAAVLGAAAVALVLFAALPRRALWLLPGLAFVLLASASVVASRYVADQAALQQQRLVGPVPDWIDRVAKGPVAYVYDGDPDWDAVWANLFWNTRITRVVDLPGTHVVGALPQAEVRIGLDGRLTPIRLAAGPLPVSYAVVAAEIDLHGTPVADAPQSLPGQRGLRLWKLDGPLGISTITRGLHPGGDIYGNESATLTAYGCSRGAFRATVIAKQDQVIEVVRDGVTVRRVPLRGEQIWRGVVPAPPPLTAAARSGRRTCTFGIRAGGLVGTTVFLFERR